MDDGRYEGIELKYESQELRMIFMRQNILIILLFDSKIQLRSLYSKPLGAQELKIFEAHKGGIAANSGFMVDLNGYFERCVFIHLKKTLLSVMYPGRN